MKIKTMEAELLEAFKNKKNISFASILKQCNLSNTGGNYQYLHEFIKNKSIDITHLKGQAHNKGRKFPKRNSINEYFENKIKITSHHLKKRLFEEKIKEEKCENCFSNEWLGKKIPLELHHIDGNCNNNNLNNIQILCPNCHSLTSNFRSKKTKNILRKKHISEEEIILQIPLHSNISQILKFFKLAPKGGNYARIQRIVNQYGLKFC